MSAAKKFCVFFIFLSAFFGLGFFLYHVSKYPSHKKLSETLFHRSRHYPKDITEAMGAYFKLPEKKINHFLNFPIKKAEKTIRIGTFGDSVTFGAEVHKGAAYPEQLGELLKTRFPLQKTEVLNFGMNGHGFRHQFFLWEKYRKLYQLDYFLYGPSGVFADRDLSFSLDFGGKLKHVLRFPAHRFILLDEENVRRIEIKGSNLIEKYKRYYSLIPSWIALRYDKQPFKMWEMHLPFLRRRIKNPFYYSNLPDYKESLKINQILLKKIKAEHDKKLLFFIAYETKLRHYQTAEIKPLKLKIYHSFLYKVFSHPSALLNELTANVYFHALTGGKNLKFKIFQCYFNPEKTLEKGEEPDLKNVRRIFIGTRSAVLGELRLNTKLHEHRKSRFFENKPKNIKSFIRFSHPRGEDLGRSPYYPLPFALEESHKVKIKPLGGKSVILPGKIKAMDASKKFFSFHTNYTINERRRSEPHYDVFFKKNKLRMDFKLRSHVQKIKLYIDNFLLGDLIMDPSLNEKPVLKLRPLKKTPSFLIMGPRDLLRERELPSRLSLYFHYVMDNHSVVKSFIPHWTCQKEVKTYFFNPPDFSPLTERSFSSG